MRQYFWLPAPDNNQSEKELEALRRQHQLILNAVGEGVYGLDLNGNVTFVNPAAAAMIDWDMEDLIGQSMHAVLHHSHADGTPYPREACPIYAAFQDGAVHRVTHEVFWRKDGTTFPVEYISTPLHDEAGQLIGAVVTFRDITQRKWAEAVQQRANEELEHKVQERTAELYAANQQLRELNQLRSRFIAMVCHEFRNPLNTIALSVSSLDRYDTQLSPPQKATYLQTIAANVERMTQMIDDILVIGKIEAKILEIQPQPLDLVDFCRSLLAETTFERACNPIRFTSTAPHLMAVLDKRLLRSILTNILLNAIRYTPDDKPIQVRISPQPPQILFEIEDEGIGIPAADQPYLFEPFHRGRNVSNIPGTGLGLNIVKQFVELQRGNIAVRSQVGVGTCFQIWLPQQMEKA
ncbi:Two-component sensor histidine kinase [Halomicronema hongdechloris C2206]|uniref:histidine kinase n=1 Tax=Halomicronema hongdechloris C2206 TaxID=1641165 RepID=A0A1Z3HQ95_9CYAN|nr:PAS domain-containing sensor histidine kinase [Halomicronema hongdechloris]ASC72490.1 Two-component sensor histidine kinase [Halomicronema hongdechloris C2206]